jgi:RNA polymerase sigma-70 factor (ECF subfamily)
LAPDNTDDALLPALAAAAAGDSACWGELVCRHHDRLRRMVALRLDPRVRARVDPSDVLQETYLEAARRLHDYLRDRPLPFFLWLRQLAGTRLAKLNRRHLGAARRDARREVRLLPGGVPGASSVALADQLLAPGSRPSETAARGELRERLLDALEQMDALDREVLALRHFEQLTNGEAARALGLTAGAASKRYIRALEKLRALVAGAGGPLEGWAP